MRWPRKLLMRWPIMAVTIALGACNLDVAMAPDEPSDPATETFVSSLQIDIASMQKTTAGIYYKDLKVGSGPALTVTPTGLVVISYAAFLKTGVEFAQTVSQTLGLSSLPPGMLNGITAAPAMREGGERIIVVPSALGFSNVAVPGVPPNSTLVFDVILNQVQ